MATQRSYAKTLTALANPEDTFGLLRSVLEGLDASLSLVRRTVEKRNALAAATPSIWPAHGWLTSVMGSRVDPVNGGADSTRASTSPATAASRSSPPPPAWWISRVQGNYGNLIVIDHGYGLETRYGHLQSFSVTKGGKVSAAT